MTVSQSILRLHLIRHGRAAASAEDYDQLRSMGETQARKLGEHLGAHGQAFDAVYCGPHRRQQHTLELCIEGAGEVGAAWPQAVLLDGLAEGPYEELLKFGLAERLTVDKKLQALVGSMRDAGSDKAARGAAIGALFNHMTGLWHRGEFGREGMQTAKQFVSQVDAALDTLLANHSGGDVAVVTSNGVIATMVARATGNANADKPVLRIANASVTIITARGGVLEVEVVSDTTHLDPSLVTLL